LGMLFILSPFLLSNYRPYYLLGIHYPFYVIPLIFIGAIYGLLRLDRGAKIFNLRTMMVVTLLFAVCISPLSPISKVFTTQDYVNYSPIEFSLDQNKKSLNDLISLVPSDASVLTQNVVFPHVSNRINAYVIPFSDYEQPVKMGEYVDHLINSSDYVLLDMKSLSPIDQIVLDKIMKDNYYGAYALGSQSVLFKKAYSDEPNNAYYVDNRTFVASHDFIVRVPPSSILDDPTSDSGEVVFSPKDASGFCISGPYIYLLPGKYEATFTIKAGSHGPEWLGMIDVATNAAVNVLSFRDLYGFELETNEWTDFTIPFGLPTLKNEVEFRVYSRGVAEILVDRVFLRRVSATPTSNFSLKTLRLPNIKVSSGNITEEDFLIHNRGTIGQVFWYGPYWSYSPGDYRTTFRLKTEPRPQALDIPVLTLSVSGRASQLESPTVLVERVLYTQDFAGNNASGWNSFTLDFTIEKPLIEVEFRGLWPSPDYDIYLAFIILETLD